ncbi:hypothetical protein R1sor_007760 [Riccia sorocarpa]|uniref:Uncharacterized protein n=1 Tax=Riccia sorocarpa TaxID=122646 RepID=A0ABD3HUU7_9MARC
MLWHSTHRSNDSIMRSIADSPALTQCMIILVVCVWGWPQMGSLQLDSLGGPKKPKNFDTYLQPVVEELKLLWNGVRAYDSQVT